MKYAADDTITMPCGGGFPGKSVQEVTKKVVGEFPKRESWAEERCGGSQDRGRDPVERATETAGVSAAGRTKNGALAAQRAESSGRTMKAQADGTVRTRR